jgi:hypothetical protein
MLKTIQQTSGKFNEWNLIQGSELDFQNNFDGIDDLDKSLLEVLAKRTVIAETRQPRSIKRSVFWEYEYAGSILDVMTLLSLARTNYHPILATEEKIGDKIIPHFDLISTDISNNFDIIPITNLGQFISDSLTFIENNPDWLTDNGFIPGIYIFTQAQRSSFTAPSILEMGLYWISLEILAGTFIDKNKWDLRNKKDRVKCFITCKGYTGSNWDFLDEAIDDWYTARNNLFHEGKEKPLIELPTKRGKQIRDFTSLLFIEMLKKQKDDIKNDIAKRMQNY